VIESPIVKLLPVDVPSDILLSWSASAIVKEADPVADNSPALAKNATRAPAKADNPIFLKLFLFFLC